MKKSQFQFWGTKLNSICTSILYGGKIEIPVRVIFLREGQCSLNIVQYIYMYSYTAGLYCMHVYLFSFLLYFHMLLLWFMLLCGEKIAFLSFYNIINVEPLSQAVRSLMCNYCLLNGEVQLRFCHQIYW